MMCIKVYVIMIVFQLLNCCFSNILHKDLMCIRDDIFACI